MSSPGDWSCALCGVKSCAAGSIAERYPAFCPMPSETDHLKEIERIYCEDDRLRNLALDSARTEAAGYCRRTRIEEIMDFARRIGAGKIGIAHCIGLIQEAKAASEIFSAQGFEVYSICCKVGSIEKGKIGLKEEEKIHPGNAEMLCSPVGQASLLAKAGTELNVVIGLCVGHDSLFFMHSKAPVTVLVAKDRVLGHNPVAALYMSNSYYRRLKERPSGD